MYSREITAGLRVDVDTLRGTRFGVPNLLTLFQQFNIKASFFFSVGPDNMGRNLWRLLRPAFLRKMLRTRAAKLYGWDIVFKGTFWPGPEIAKRAADQIQAVSAAGHEIGLHAWDHYQWQSHIEEMNIKSLQSINDKAMAKLEKVIGHRVDCMAAPSWKVTRNALEDREQRKLRYCSDCRGESIFYPMTQELCYHLDSRGKSVLYPTICDKTYNVPQIPTTLPTFDELLGRNNITASNYNKYLLDLFQEKQLNVLTIHAEAEGVAYHELFQRFLKQACKQNISFNPLGTLLENSPTPDSSSMVAGRVEGREGWVSCQEVENEQ